MVIPIFRIGGIEVNAPENWQSIQILATFDNSSVQANISTSEFIFVNAEAKLIRDYIAGGVGLNTNGIFEGLSFEIEMQDDNNDLQVFSGYLNFNTYEEISPVMVKCSVKKDNGLTGLKERSAANSFGYLESIGVITDADYVDVPYLVEKLSIEGDMAIVSLSIFMMTMMLQDLIKENVKDAKLIIALTAQAAPGSVASSTFYTISTAIANFTFTAIALIQLYKLINRLLVLLIPPIRKHKGMRLRRMLEIASDYLGFELESNISHLDTVIFLPSKPFDDKPIAKGIPNSTDFGYQLSEIFELCNNLFNSKIQLTDGVLNMYSLNDSFWIKDSPYRIPSTLDEKIKYNNADFKARTFLAFNTDGQEDWTIDNFEGTNYEIIVTPIQETDRNKNLMSGLGEPSFPLCLGSPKDGFNGLENLFLELLTGFDGLINFFGGNSNSSNLIGQRLETLKVSQKNHSVAKLLYMVESSNGLKIPLDNRDFWSAKVLWDDYHNYNSFVSNNFGGQRRLFDERKRAFGFGDLLQTIDDSFCKTAEDEDAKIESIKWQFDKDFAIMDYWTPFVYTENLKETFIEG